MNILVLGGNGFIGSHLVDRLLRFGHAVRIYDRNEEHFRKKISNVDYRFGDFGNRGLLVEALQGIDIVFHLITTSLPKTSNDDPSYDVQSNVLETLFLLDKCLESGVKRIVFTSSGGTIYGRPSFFPVSEDAPHNPECSYGIVKLTIEKYLSLYRHLHGLDYVIVRPSNPYGPRQNPNGIQGVIPVFLGKVATGAPIEIWGNGEIIRDYLYIDDLIDCICRVAFNKLTERVFNVGSGEGVSLNKILDIIRDITRKDIFVNYSKSRSFDIPEIYLNISKAKNNLGWQPTTSLYEGILQTWTFVKSLK